MAVIISSVILVIIAICTLFFYKRYKKRFDNTLPVVKTLSESNATLTDLETIINSVIGISKHAAFLIEHSSIARIKKLASGGGGELFVAQVMEPSLSRRVGQLVIQKVVFIKSKMSEEAFYQEVGIMIMLSKFPHFCQIIGYTEQPASIILKYYPDGSLYDWIRSNQCGTKNVLKIAMEISLGLNTMHSYYLAHCDLKPQNILVGLSDGTPSCFVTDFGITQILSDSIIASRSFNVINLRGLSVSYASPEAFKNFKTKKYVSVDFKKYDIFSFGCLLYELLTRRSPWS
jgi:serine/threonine protein kinase